jgi:hypothetical protein
MSPAKTKGRAQMKDLVEWLTLVLVMSAVYVATTYVFFL